MTSDERASDVASSTALPREGRLTFRTVRGAGPTPPVYTVDTNSACADDVASPLTGSHPMVTLHTLAAKAHLGRHAKARRAPA